jgi:FkbM family methyltransferase
MFETEVLHTRYGDLEVIKDDSWISQSLRLLGEWSQSELETLGRIIKVLEVVGDVEMIEAGGFIGDHTVPLAGMVKKLHVFEPVKPVREILERNLSLNGVRNVEVYPFALGPFNKKVSFNIGTIPDTITSTQMQNDLKGEFQVEMRTIDSFGLKPKLIKLDVEGCELPALVGAQETLREFAPVLFVEENTVTLENQLPWEMVCGLWSYYHYWLFSFPVWNPQNFNGYAGPNPWGSGVSFMGMMNPLFGATGRAMFEVIHSKAGEDKRFFDKTIQGRLRLETPDLI